MEATIKKTTAGNPSITRPKFEKDARFKLINQYDLIKPKDADTGQIVDNPYPPIYIATNEGVAKDAKGEYRQWRYLFGYKTIWVDEQTKPVPTKNQINSEKNDIIFKGGFLRVKKDDTAKIQALMLNDAFEGNEDPVNDIPKVYELIDDTAAARKLRSLADVAFEAESEARSCSVEEMLPIAQLYGIDTTQDEDMIRTAFIFQAKQNPAKFLENVANPKFKVKYTVTEALKAGLISVTDNKIVYMESGKPLFEVNGNGDVAEQIAIMVVKNDDVAVKLVEQLELNLGGEEG